MKEMKGIFLLVVLIGIVLLASQVFYIVNEQEQVIITQFGEPQGVAITEPGLKAKIPFLQNSRHLRNT